MRACVPIAREVFALDLPIDDAKRESPPRQLDGQRQSRRPSADDENVVVRELITSSVASSLVDDVQQGLALRKAEQVLPQDLDATTLFFTRIARGVRRDDHVRRVPEPAV